MSSLGGVTNENAERLKAQGNTLHVKGQYRAAYKKYSEAIKEDPRNAVYWANRAASGLAMKEYVNPYFNLIVPLPPLALFNL